MPQTENIASKSRKKLTAQALANLGLGEYTDPLLPGLTLRVGVRRKVWQLRHRYGGAERRSVLGYYPQMSLSQAREQARNVALRIDQGAAPEPAPIHPRSTPTLGVIIDRYEAMRTAEGGRIKSLAEAMRALRHGLGDKLNLPINLFTKTELRAARDRIAERGNLTASNRLLGYVSPVLRWAAEEDIIEHNFAVDLRRAPERQRERVLSMTELVKVWNAAAQLEGLSAPHFGRLVRFAICTAQRRGECAALKFGHILDGCWRQRDNKASRPQSLRLPQLALKQLGHGEAADLVFPGDGGGQLKGWSKLKVRLDRLAGIEDWTLHDLRRSAASHMQELGVSQDVIGAVLNHSIAGVGGVYMRAGLDAAKADALAHWADHLQRQIAGAAA